MLNQGQSDEAQIVPTTFGAFFQFFQFAMAFLYGQIYGWITWAMERMYVFVVWASVNSFGVVFFVFGPVWHGCMHLFLWIMHQDVLVPHELPNVGDVPIPPYQMEYASMKWILAASVFAYAGNFLLSSSKKAMGVLQIHFPGLTEGAIVMLVIGFELFGTGVIWLCAWAHVTRRERLRTIIKFFVTSALASLSFLLGDVSTGDWLFTCFAWCFTMTFMCIMIYIRSSDDIAVIDCITAINMGFSYVHRAKVDWHVWFFGIPIGLKAVLEYCLDHHIL